MSQIQGGATRLSWLAGAGALLSLLACYGTLGLIAILSLMGVSLALNVHVWAATIVAFAIIAVLGVCLGYRQHRNVAPIILATAGALLVTWAIYGSYSIRMWFGIHSRLIEVLGFVGLIVAAFWDWRRKKVSRV